MPPADRSVLLGRSAFMAPGDGRGDVQPVYEPVEDGGFRIRGSRRQFNRAIVHGQNRVWTGDVPIFRMDTALGVNCYTEERVFPLWARPDAPAGQRRSLDGNLAARRESGGRQDAMARRAARGRPPRFDRATPNINWPTPRPAGRRP